MTSFLGGLLQRPRETTDPNQRDINRVNVKAVGSKGCPLIMSGVGILVSVSVSTSSVLQRLLKSGAELNSATILVSRRDKSENPLDRVFIAFFANKPAQSHETVNAALLSHFQMREKGSDMRHPGIDVDLRLDAVPS